MSIATPEAPLTGLSRYAVKGKIGSGGMATVYLAYDATLRRDVALKVMHEHLVRSPETVRRFESEAHTVASLSHENVVKVFDYGQIESRPFIVMEYVDGETLASYIDRFKTLPNLVVVEIARQIAQGLSFTHAQGVLHRDIKPDNIIIDRAGCVKITDFGIAYLVNRESLTLTGSFVGSPRFISPEQAEGKAALCGKADVFSLGVVMYLSLTGALPFDAETPMGAMHAIMVDTPPHPFNRNPRVLFWLSDLIDLFLSKERSVRPDAPTALALLEKGCCAHGLRIGKEHLLKFISDPARCAAEEANELFDHYRSGARAEIKNRRIVSALKKLEQASAFGKLGDDDRKLVAAYKRNRLLLKAAVIAAGIVFLAGGGIWTTRTLLSAHKDREAAARRLPPAAVAVTPNPETPPVKTETKDDHVPPPAFGDKRDAKSVVKPAAPKQFRRKSDNAVASVRDSLKNAVHLCFLSVKTNPPWVKVYIDGIERGTTPVKTLYEVAPGSHQIRLLKSAFTEYRSKISVAGPDTVSLRVQLLPDGHAGK
jgi:predicted Ser/Thr protein kinase